MLLTHGCGHSIVTKKSQRYTHVDYTICTSDPLNDAVTITGSVLFDDIVYKVYILKAIFSHLPGGLASTNVHALQGSLGVCSPRNFCTVTIHIYTTKEPRYFVFPTVITYRYKLFSYFSYVINF